MNAKPGQLCLFIRNTMPQRCMEHMVGAAVIRVTEQIHAKVVRGSPFLPEGMTLSSEPAWLYEGPLLRCACHQEIRGFLDADLMPLRNDEGNDEIVAKIGKASDLPTYTSVSREVAR